MKFTCLALILLGCFTIGLADENVAVVVKSRGDVDITPNQKVKSVDAKKGYVLQHKDKLKTAKGAFCAIKFLDDKSLLRIKENSSCIIEGTRKKSTIEKNIFVEIGTFFASIFKQKTTFQVTTPTSVASVKGTKFWTIQNKITSETKYVCIEGVLEVENKAGKVLVRAGQTGIVQSKTRLPIVRLTDSGDIPDEEESSSEKSLDFEFNDSNGQKKVLRLQIQD